MRKNYFKIAFRNLVKNIGYSGINIFGLAIGLTSCLLIGIYVQSELSFDKFHKDIDNLYRVNVTYSMGGSSQITYMTPTALLPNLLRQFNEVESGTRVFDVAMFSPVVVNKDDHKYQEGKFFYVDSTFFDVFSFPLLKGDANKALVDPSSVILTQKMATKYFGNQEAFGETLMVDGQEYKVTGILADVPDNSHIHFDFLGSFSSLRASKSEIWWSANYATYVKLNNSANTKAIANDIEQLVRQKLGKDVFQGEDRIIFDLFPVKDLHLYSKLPVEIQPQSNIQYVYIISLIGILILVIACINYMNLATARSADRAKEVGMRKVLGAYKTQLFYQFMSESFVITLISGIFALVFVNISLIPFNQLTGKSLSMAAIYNPQISIGLMAVIILVSFLAGAYPALSISSFKPGEVLKGSFKRSTTGNLLRKILVIVQFSISILLVIGTLVIYKQLNFMQNIKLGYNKENTLIIPTDREVNKNFDKIKIALEQRADVTSVSIASESPTEINGGYTIDISENEGVSVNAVTVDRDFIKTMNMELAAGRDFTDADVTNATLDSVELRTYGFIVNEQLLKQLLMPTDNAIGKQATLNGRKGQIIGVVKDFHFASLHRKINPLVIFIEPSQYNKLFIKLKSDKLSQTLSELDQQWSQLVPNRPFVFTFMDQEYDALYRNEERLGSIFTVFACLAISIACMGLLGLVSFTVQQRSKEIGVRKVLGATIASLFGLISKDFTKLIVIAFLISAPLGYYLMNNWLTDFEYRTGVGYIPIIVSILLTIVVALLTISYQAIRAARMNPTDTLRSE